MKDREKKKKEKERKCPSHVAIIIKTLNRHKVTERYNKCITFFTPALSHTHTLGLGK